eukprot:scaffold31355_cov68-Phaeocystis_antarctica.AAC.2
MAARGTLPRLYGLHGGPTLLCKARGPARVTLANVYSTEVRLDTAQRNRGSGDAAGLRRFKGRAPTAEAHLVAQIIYSARYPAGCPPGNFIASTGAGYVSPKDGDYARAEALGLRVVLMLVETFGGLGPALVEELRKGAEWRANKLSASEYDETTWSLPFPRIFENSQKNLRRARIKKNFRKWQALPEKIREVHMSGIIADGTSGIVNIVLFRALETAEKKKILGKGNVVGADVHGVHDAAPLGGGAVLGRAGGGRGARPVGGGRPTSGALDGRRGA